METARGDLQRIEDPKMRPILQRCRVGRLAAVHGNPLGSLCKPEVTGSIPVRSIEEALHLGAIARAGEAVGAVAGVI